MKKTLIVLGAVAIALLMVSSATAVQQTSSETVMKKVKQIEKIRVLPLGLISWLIGFIKDLILALIELIPELIAFITNMKILIGLIELILSWPERIAALIEDFVAFIEWLKNLINPSEVI